MTIPTPPASPLVATPEHPLASRDPITPPGAIAVEHEAVELPGVPVFPTPSRASAIGPLRVVILDDSPLIGQLLTLRLQAALPDVVIDVRQTPDETAIGDVYLIDNMFGETPVAAHLAKKIRAHSPSALIVAFSATLNVPLLKQLLASGCSAACDKAVPEDLNTLLEVVRRYDIARRSRPRKDTFASIVRSLTDLLRQWNDRMRLKAEAQGDD